MQRNPTPRVYAICTTSSGVDVLSAMSSKIPLTCIIGPGAGFPSEGISGFFPMERFAAEIGATFLPIQSYSLQNVFDKEKLLNEEIDILVVVGWQRLIPDWLINHCKLGAVGTHGSPFGITKGRGRSPQNWALILGGTQFQLSLFLIDHGVDSGPVISSATFELCPGDDINDSYLKAALASAAMIVEAVGQGKIFRGSGASQSGAPYYLPQRLPSDGEIDWYRSSVEICRFISGLTKPYPGAFSLIGKGKLQIWKAKPFLGLNSPFLSGFDEGLPGQISYLSASGRMLVKTIDGYVCVEDWELCFEDSGEIKVGLVLPSVNFNSQLRSIISRHTQKFPDMPVSPFILDYLVGS